MILQAPASSKAASPVPAAANVPRGGTLVFALNSDPPTLNPSWSVGQTHMAGCKVMEGLVATAPDRSEIRPQLAESWQISPDGLTYTFQLQKGVSWHDGRPFTAEDVKWSIENVNKYHTIGRISVEKIASTEVTGPNTLVMKLKEPFAPFLSSLTCADGGAISPQHLADADPDVRKNQRMNQAPIGTGPFVFKEWIPGDRIVLTRNPNYWKPDLPYLDQIVLKIVPDSTSMVLALRAGEINYISDFFVNADDVSRLKDDPRVLAIGGADVPTFQMVQINHRRPPLDKPEVRKALFMAMDRDLLLKNVFQGVGRLQPNMIDNLLAVSAAPDIDLNQMYPFDLARANKLLDDAGLPRKADGTRFSIKMLYESARAEWKDIAEITRSTWSEIGVQLTLEPVERAVMLDKVFKKRDFDTTLQTYNSRGDPAIGVALAFVCEDDRDPPTFGNSTGYCRQDVDQIFQEASRTTDFEKRRAIYQRVQRILADDLPLLVFMGRAGAALADRKFDYSVPHAASSQSSGWEFVQRLP
jgi:peptide/nickel transport system substrate-binding protein